jgi:tRNA (cmo5U34)-methyltransferase
MTSEPTRTLKPVETATATGEGAVDRIFADEKSRALDFKFGAETATVFDDMVSRSVPFYDEIQRMVCELAADFAVAGSSVCDLGCSTGTTLLALNDVIDPGARFVGVDNSEEMLAKAKAKLAPAERKRRLDLVCADLNDCHAVEDASVVTMILTLQFVRPLYRERILQHIYDELRHDGCLILVEKVTGAHTLLNRLFIEHYYDYKRRMGYSDLEISQKREALENVLIPYRYEENRDLLLETGFIHVEEFFRYYNFCGMIAVK